MLQCPSDINYGKLPLYSTISADSDYPCVYFEPKAMCDYTISINGCEFHVHSFVLYRHSAYFRRIFEQKEEKAEGEPTPPGTSELSNKKLLQLPLLKTQEGNNINANNMVVFLFYLYREQLILRPDMSALRTAKDYFAVNRNTCFLFHHFECTDLLSSVREYRTQLLHTNSISNCIGLWSDLLDAHTYQWNDVKERCLDLIGKHSKDSMEHQNHAAEYKRIWPLLGNALQLKVLSAMSDGLKNSIIQFENEIALQRKELQEIRNEQICCSLM